MDMSDAQLRELDPGSRTSTHALTEDEAAAVRMYAREQKELERLMPTGVAR